MRWFNPLTAWAPLVLCSSVLAKDYMIGTRSLKPCMKNSGITATYVDVAFHTNTSKLHFDINGYSAISGKVHVLATVYAYGFKVFDLSFDPCERAEWTQLCPMSPRRLYIQSNENVGEDLVAQIPSVAFQVPDLDGYVRIEIVSADEKREPLACVDALLTNGVTIEKGAVSWVTAFIAGGALFWAMVVISASNPSLHYYHLATAKYAAYSLAFFTFLQNQALIGMTSVPLPPIVSAWTQNLVWAVGIVEMDFLQTFFHWYIRSTGGQRSELFNQISATSVLVTKRDLSMMPGMSLRSLVRRELDEDDPQNYEHITVKGIERVAFKANIEQTNLFLTSYSMYILFVTVVVILFLVFRGLVELMARKRVVGMDNRLTVFREHWKIILKKIAFCLVIIGFPALIALSLWEITMKDSPAAVVLAVIIFLVVTILMAQAVLKLYMLLRRTGVMPFSAKGPLARFSTKSAAREKPAFTSWRDSDPGLSEAKATASRDLKQFTILTIPYRRSGAYWVLPLCLFVFTKSALIGLSQQHLYNAPGEDESSVGTVKGTAQAIGFLVMDLLWLIGVAWVRPWMDKPTNILGVASAAVGLVNAVCLLIFTEVIHGQANPAKPIVGVLFVIFNIVMCLILLIVTVVSAIYALLDWKKGHPGLRTAQTDRNSAEMNPPSATEYGNHVHTSTPDPFLPPSHTNDSVPAANSNRAFSHLFSEDGRQSVATSVDSRDITGLQPTEPNTSMTSFNGHGHGTGVIVSPTGPGDASGYPLAHSATNTSNQVPLGVVMISSGRSDDGRSTYTDSIRSGRSRDGQRKVSNPQRFPPQAPFQRQDSRMSQRSMNSTHSYRSFSRPGPVQGVYSQGKAGNASQISVNRDQSPQSIQENITDRGVAL